MKKLFVIFIWTLWLMPFSVSLAAAEDANNQNSVIQMEEVVVTATRQEEKISSVPANVSIITKEDIQNSPARDVPELLRTQEGIHVSDISGNQRSYTVDLRGFGETAGLNTLVLVDGRRINQADLSGTDWTLIPLDRIEKIEIVRGGRGSVLYGDNAAGGVINIITKQGRNFEAGIETAGGSYNTLKSDIQVSGAKYDLSYDVSGSYLTSNGYRQNSDTRAKDGGINLDYHINPLLQLNLSNGYHQDDTGLPGAIKDSDFLAGVSRTDTLHPDDYANVEDYYFEGGPELYFLTNSLFKINMAYRNRDSVFFSSFPGGTYEGDTKIGTVTVLPQFVLKEKVYGLSNSLTYGLDFIQDDEDIANTSSYSGRDLYDLKKKNYGFYLHDEINLTDRLSVSGGYRYDKAEFTFDPSTPDKTDASENLYTSGINYNIYENSQIYLSYSRTFRYPVLDEFFNFYYNTINTALNPQTSDDYEIGIRHHFSESLYGNLNLFQIDTKNEIYLNPISYANENLDGETCRKGMELAITKDFEKISLSATYVYTDASIFGGVFHSHQVPGVPKDQASFNSVVYILKGLSLTFNGVYVGRRPFISDFGNDFEYQDDYIVLNTKLKYNWEKMSVFLNVNNLTDEKYSEYGVLGGYPLERAYYPSPGINWFLGFSAKI